MVQPVTGGEGSQGEKEEGGREGRGGAWGPVMSPGSCLDPLSAKYRSGGGGEMNGGSQEGTGGFGQAGKQCP